MVGPGCNSLLAEYHYYSDVDFRARSPQRSFWENGGYDTNPASGMVARSGDVAAISQDLPPDGSYQYELAATVLLSRSGGTYTLYLEASPDAILGLPNQSRGSFYAFSIQNPTYIGSECLATTELYKAVNGSISKVATSPTPCSPIETYHAAVGNDGALHFWVGSDEYINWKDSSTGLSGAPGVGGGQMPFGNGISRLQIGLCDRVAPGSIDPATVTVLVNGQINVRAARVWDDKSGVGLRGYLWFRDDNYLAITHGPELHDSDASSGEHTYAVQSVDFHGNLSSETRFKVRLDEANGSDRSGATAQGVFGGRVTSADDTGDFIYVPTDVYYDGSGNSFTWTSYYGQTPPAGVFYGLLPSDVATYEAFSQYDLNKSMDNSANVAEFHQRVQDAKWLSPAKAVLLNFDKNATQACLSDMNNVDVGNDKIRSLAGNDRSKGGTSFVDYRALSSPVKSLINSHADLTAVQSPHLIIFNLANFWQGSFQYMVGSVLHELIHIAHYESI